MPLNELCQKTTAVINHRSRLQVRDCEAWQVRKELLLSGCRNKSVKINAEEGGTYLCKEMGKIKDT